MFADIGYRYVRYDSPAIHQSIELKRLREPIKRTSGLWDAILELLFGPAHHEPSNTLILKFYRLIFAPQFLMPCLNHSAFAADTLPPGRATVLWGSPDETGHVVYDIDDTEL